MVLRNINTGTARIYDGPPAQSASPRVACLPRLQHTYRLSRGCKRLYNDGCKISREASSGLGVGDTDGGALGPVVVEPDTNSGIEGYCNPYT